METRTPRLARLNGVAPHYINNNKMPPLCPQPPINLIRKPIGVEVNQPKTAMTTVALFSVTITASAQLHFALESAQIIARTYVISWPKKTARRRCYHPLFPVALQHREAAETSIKGYVGCERPSLGSGDEHAFDIA
ncbi:hypothetical protein HPB51_018539 [Rhipicephalus microplus]|uniref:Uncharacterized protein n=1 Tax=Rhipicephalus microplus TaxID=6941 RepID=A0A9J6DJ32_RHIMP|nr:hypothetical protein HPB51_018539 [Rhipicephalus microplus]